MATEWRAPRRAWVLVAALLLAAGCGGGTQIEKFVPTRVLVFGDETSVIEDTLADANGRKHTVNALAADNVTRDCKSNALWVQWLAAGFGLALPQCNPAPNAVVAPASRIYAEAGKGVADVATQVDTHLQGGGTFTSKDLAAVLAGANDILAQYQLYDTTVNGVQQTEAVLAARLEAAGITLAAQVNRIADAGGKVIISTVPDLGLTPYALAEKAAHTDIDRAALLTRLTGRLNAKLRANIQNDGRKIGLILADELAQTLVKFPTSTSPALTNVTAAVCDPAKATTLPDCTTQTLITDGSASTFLWADATHLSPAGHRVLGNLALSRASGNPF